MGVKLSILVPSVHTRRTTFLPRMQERLFSMWEALPKSRQEEVEILFLTDNKQMMLGEKRNEMVRMAQGEYVVHIDDDDRIEDDYIVSLLNAIDESGADVITFYVSVSINNQEPKICHYSPRILADYNEPDAYYRLPNHICCTKRELAMKISYPNVPYGEDSAYAKLLKPHLKTWHEIGRVLYHYDYSEIGTESQSQLTGRKARVRPGDVPLVDLIILSNATDTIKMKMTQNAINTAITGANGLPISVTVLEQQYGIDYEGAKTMRMDCSFNYNMFANHGAKYGQAPWIMISNNDVVFFDAWLHHLLAANYPVVSPKEPSDSRQQHVTENQTGDVNGTHFSGWCFMIKRTLWEQIGGFDESYTFWLSDDVVIEQIKKEGVEPMLVPAAKVMHHGSVTLNSLPFEEQQDYCWGDLADFNERFGQNKFKDNVNYQEYLKRKGLCRK